MILRRTGATLESVVPDFSHKAITEIAFRRTGETFIPEDEFEQQYHRVALHELFAEAEGEVKSQAEQELLDDLRDQLHAIERAAGPDALVVVESRHGHDFPRTHARTTTLVAGTLNRFHFSYTVDPPLRIGVYQPRG